MLCLTFILALAAGWSGYALPDDQLAGTGLRIFEGILVGIPVVGSRATFVLSGGEFPGVLIERLYWLHVAVIPVLLVVVLALRLRGTAHRSRPARVVAVRSVGLLLITSGVLVLMAGLVTIGPVWLHGPVQTAPLNQGRSSISPSGWRRCASCR